MGKTYHLNYYDLDAKITIFSTLLQKTYFDGIRLTSAIKDGLKDGTFDFFGDYTNSLSDAQKINKIKSQYYYLLDSCNKTLAQSGENEINVKDKSFENKEFIASVLDMICRNERVFFTDTLKENPSNDYEKMKSNYIYQRIKECKSKEQANQTFEKLKQELDMQVQDLKLLYFSQLRKHQNQSKKKFKNLIDSLSELRIDELEKFEILSRIITNVKSSNFTNTELEFLFSYFQELSDNKHFIVEVPTKCPHCPHCNDIESI